MNPTAHPTDQIRALEQDIRAKQAQLVELIKSRGPEPVADFVLLGPGGTSAPLSSLFGDKDDLIVIHNMGSSCPYCTLWADGFNGMLPHLEDRAAFVVVSPDAPDVQQAFAASRGWNVRMLSNGESGFTEAMGYVREHEGRAGAWPGFSTFRRGADGSIARIGHTSFGPGDAYCALWHMFPLLANGVDGWQARLRYDEPA